MQASRRYHIHEAIGRGAFGTVYRATLTGDGGFKKKVAVKMLNDNVDGWDEVARRLRDEARVLGLLRHRVILQVDGLVQLDGRWAVVMEYVRGVSLLALIREGRLPLGPSLEVIGDVAGALHIAYSGEGPDGDPLRLIHRDIKPSNIQISTNGEVKLLDFGIARADFDARESETTELVLGTPGYMGPERFDMVDGPESDIYALGVVLCEAATGRKFGKTSANREKHNAHVGKRLGTVRKKLGGDFGIVEQLLRDMLQYDHAKRPTGREVERRVRDLRTECGGLWLAEWAEGHVGELLDKQGPVEGDTLAGATLIEGSAGDAFTDEVNAMPVEAEDVAVVDEPTSAAPNRAVLIGVAAVGAFALVVGAGGIAVGLQLLNQESPSTEPLVDPPAVIAQVDVKSEVEPAAPQAEVPAQPDAQPVAKAVPDKAPDAVVAAAPPEPDKAVERPEPKEEPRTPAPAKAAGKAGPLITGAKFAAWMQGKPSWQPQAAQAEGRADANYLSGWSGGQPSNGAAAVTSVNWGAAAAYCGSKGLAALGAEPTSWSYPGGGPLQEWRVGAKGVPAWRQFDGTVSEYTPKRSESNAFVGFRCSR